MHVRQHVFKGVGARGQHELAQLHRVDEQTRPGAGFVVVEIAGCQPNGCDLLVVVIEWVMRNA